MRDGFSSEEPNGKIDLATKKGIAAFSTEYGIPEDAEDVIKHMFFLSIVASVPIVDEKKLSIIKDGVAKRLRDPDSIMLRNVHLIMDADAEMICGEVNARNGYGGYVGYTTFVDMSSSEAFF